jgi:hypothetical protein
MRIDKALILGAALVALAGPSWAAGVCTVTPGDLNADGTPDLRIEGGTGPKILLIELSQTQTIVSLDCEGNNNFTGPSDVNHVDFGGGIQSLDTKLFGDSTITLNIIGPITGRAIGFLLRGGAAGATVNVCQPPSTGAPNPCATGSLANSSLLVEVRSGQGPDRFYFNLPPGGVNHSTVLMRAESGDGNDWLTATTPGPVTNGSVVEFKLDPSGNANRLFYDHTGTISNSSVLVDVQGGAGVVDVGLNNITGQVGAGGSLRYRAQMSRGKDQVTTNFDLATFSVAAGGEARFKIDGQADGDIITFTRNGTSGGTIAGLFELAVNGGAGSDKITVDLAGLAVTGTQRLRIDGFSGNELINVTNEIASGNPNLEFLVHGGAGLDKINLALTNNGTNLPANYGPALGAVLDGGFFQNDVCTVTGNAIVLERGCEF